MKPNHCETCLGYTWARDAEGGPRWKKVLPRVPGVRAPPCRNRPSQGPDARTTRSLKAAQELMEGDDEVCDYHSERCTCETCIQNHPERIAR